MATLSWLWFKLFFVYTETFYNIWFLFKNNLTTILLLLFYNNNFDKYFNQLYKNSVNSQKSAWLVFNKLSTFQIAVFII